MSKPQRVVAAGLAPAKPVFGRGGIRHGGGLNLPRGGRAERGNLGLRCERRSHKWKNHEGKSTEAEPRGGTTRSSEEFPDKGMERRGCVMEPKFNEPTSNGRSR